jgi:hypothetical protein
MRSSWTQRSALPAPPASIFQDFPTSPRVASIPIRRIALDMPPARPAHPSSLARLVTALLASCVLACSAVDDQPPVDDTDDTEPTSCVAHLQAAEVCLPGMTFESVSTGRGGAVILVDDPGVAVQVANGWLLQVASEADYVASHRAQGPTCTAACGWCGKGQSLCHQGLDERGKPVGCVLCLPYDVPDPRGQCEVFLAACPSRDGSSPAEDTGAEDTGADSEAMALPRAPRPESE